MLGLRSPVFSYGNTIFHARKKSFTDLLAAICIILNAAKGVSALQLARDLKCQHKSAWILSHKIRQALASETANSKLSGEIEIDGCYVGGHIRPANLKENRIDRRLAPHQSGKRRVVIALRERKGRTHTFIGKHEPEGVEIAQRIVANGSTIIADEAAHWDVLPFSYKTSQDQSFNRVQLGRRFHQSGGKLFLPAAAHDRRAAPLR